MTVAYQSEIPAVAVGRLLQWTSSIVLGLLMVNKKISTFIQWSSILEKSDDASNSAHQKWLVTIAH
jgi:hypothetical protein